jgi:hypothetical protein
VHSGYSDEELLNHGWKAAIGSGKITVNDQGLVGKRMVACQQYLNVNIQSANVMGRPVYYAICAQSYFFTHLFTFFHNELNHTMSIDVYTLNFATVKFY